MKKLFLAFMLSTSASHSFACSCAVVSEQDKLMNSDNVLTLKVLKATDGSFEGQILEVFRGEGKKNHKVFVKPTKLCPKNLTTLVVGAAYLVSANQIKSENGESKLSVLIQQCNLVEKVSENVELVNWVKSNLKNREK